MFHTIKQHIMLFNKHFTKYCARPPKLNNKKIYMLKAQHRTPNTD